MEDPRRESKIDYLKKMQYELEHLGRGGFLKLIADKQGEEWAGVVARIGIEDTARRIMSEQIQSQLRELGEGT
jgi:hypothetical protein